MLGRILATLTLLAVAAVGCGGGDSAEESRVVGDALTVYSSQPQTGPLAPVSRDIVRAEKLALDEAGGRAGDYRISYVSLDSADPKTGRWSPDQVAENARTAVEDLQTIAYLGELEAGASTISLPILNEGGMLQVSPMDTFAGLTAKLGPGEPDKYYPSGRRTFTRMVADDRAQARTLVATLRRERVRRVVLADDRQVAGRATADALTRELPVAGIDVVDRKRLDAAGDVPEDLGRDVHDERADAFLYTGAYGPFAAGVLRAVHAASPRVLLLGTDTFAAAPGLAELPAGVKDRLVVTALAAPRDAAERSFARRFRERFGSRPDARAVLGYRAMQLVLQTVARAGAGANSRPTVIREALETASTPRAGFASFRFDGSRLVRAAPDV